MVAILAILAKWLVFRHFLGAGQGGQDVHYFPLHRAGAHHRTLMPA